MHQTVKPKVCLVQPDESFSHKKNELCNQCWISRLIDFRSLRVSFSRGAVNISAAECKDGARCVFGILPRGLANWVARLHFAPALFVFKEMCCTLTGLTAKRIRRHLTLTYATVWPGETRSTLATVPVFTIHTRPGVVAVEREKEGGSGTVQFSHHYSTINRLQN